MKVLITGGVGFIGSNLVDHITSAGEGHEIVVLGELSTGLRSNLDGLPVELSVRNVADEQVVRQATQGVDVSGHLGALGSVPHSGKDPVPSHVANLNGTLNVLEAAREVGAYVVFASSSSVYGANTKLSKVARR